jgi:LmbE family N-acetylglucosaminyl deacetylase
MSAKQTVLAVAAHPDDIEITMAGTLLRLQALGWDVHYMNIANGSCGTAVDPEDVIIAKRTAEAKAACELVGFSWHPPICNDLEVYHCNEQIRQVLAVIREVSPSILLTQSPVDYMEEHQNASRVACTAAFCRGMLNYYSVPTRAPIAEDIAVYHALPHGLRDPLRKRLRAGQYVEIGSTIPTKREMLACHRSQKEWLDVSQGMDAYLDVMVDFGRQVGELSGSFEYAEGWRRHSHLGYSATEIDPLSDALGELCVIDEAYERWLDEA